MCRADLPIKPCAVLCCAVLCIGQDHLAALTWWQRDAEAAAMCRLHIGAHCKMRMHAPYCTGCNTHCARQEKQLVSSADSI
jgi:hypothetical protein